MTSLALSSYWKRECWKSVGEFFKAGADLGFRAYEVSGLRRDTFYDEVRPGQYSIASFHSPAPPMRGASCPMGNGEMRRAEIVLNSLDGERRRQAVELARRCVDVAHDYGATLIVLHVGTTDADPALADRLARLALDSRVNSPEADALRSRLITQRKHRREERMAALRCSLDDLALYASTRNVRLGVENRPICEMPCLDEVQQIMEWHEGDVVGYWHDTGHAQVQEALGFTPHRAWLEAFGNRTIGIHLHDAVGLDVHRSPGAGSVNWMGLASLAPANVLRVMEVNHTVSGSGLLSATRYLESTGWV